MIVVITVSLLCILSAGCLWLMWEERKASDKADAAEQSRKFAYEMAEDSNRQRDALVKDNKIHQERYRKMMDCMQWYYIDSSCQEAGKFADLFCDHDIAKAMEYYVETRAATKKPTMVEQVAAKMARAEKARDLWAKDMGLDILRPNDLSLTWNALPSEIKMKYIEKVED